MEQQLTNMKPNREWMWVSAVSIVGLVLLTLWASIRGALGIPRNDDWVYLHMAQWLSQSGEFIVESGSLTNASGLVFMSQPVIWLFGFNVAALQIFVGLIGVLGLLCTWILLRTFLNISLSVVSLLALVFSPFWATLSFSFMTDVPAFSFQMLALALLVRSNQKNSQRILWVSAALLAALFAFSIREYAIVAGLTVIGMTFYWLRKHDLKQTIFFTVIALIWVLSAFALYSWRTSLNNATVSPPALSRSDLYGAVVQFGQLLIVLGVFIWPAIAGINWKKLIQKITGWRLAFISIAFTSTLIFFSFLYFRVSLTLGNTFTAFGSYAGILPLGSYPEVIPGWVFLFIEITGAVGFSLCLVLVLVLLTDRNFYFTLFKKNENQIYSTQLVLGIFTLGTLSCLGLVALFTTAPLIDRYVFGLIPITLALVFSLRQIWSIELRNAKLSSLFALGLIAIVGLIYSDSSMLVDGAKWKLGKQVESLGYPASSIDAGYEWFGFHQEILAEGKYVQPINNWWTTLYQNPSVCVLGGIGAPQSEGIHASKIISEYVAYNITGVEYRIWAVESHERCRK